MAHLLPGAALAPLCALALVTATPTPARAEVGLGIFLGEPIGLTLKVDLERRSSLEFLVGATSARQTRSNYGHLSYLVAPVIGHGRRVSIHLRLGLGVALFDDDNGFADELNVAARAPLQVGWVFRRVPLEIYAEAALKLNVIDADDDLALLDLDGGAGLRLLF